MTLANSTTRISLKNILYATDLSPASEAALLFAEDIARRYGAKLFATHVISSADTRMLPSESWGMVQDALDETARRDMHQLAVRLRGLTHQMVLRHGDVWEVISELVETNDIDLLVMGTHGRSGIERLLMGSVAEEIFRQASCPVLTVGPKAAKARPEADFKDIVFATDFSPESLTATAYAVSLAQDFQARLTFLHTVTQDVGPVPNSELIVFDRMSALRELVPSEADLWCRPEFVVKFGQPGHCILETAAETNANLIVLGVRPAEGSLAVSTHLATATAHTVVSHAGCPVLTIRG